MPSYGYEIDPTQLRRNLKALQAHLREKGLVEGTSKYLQVFHRKWPKWQGKP